MNPEELNVVARIYSILSLIGTEEALQMREGFFEIIKMHGLNHMGCVYRVSNFKEIRWGGSFEENLAWAREVIAGTKEGDASRLIIYDVMIEYAEYLYNFEEDEEAQKAVFANKEYQDEVNLYFDELVANIDKYPYEIPGTLCYWYANVGDIYRLRQVAHAMKPGRFDADALVCGYSEEDTRIQMHWYRSI